MFTNLLEQMRRVRRRDALRREMPADVQIRGIFPLFDYLMLLLTFAHCVLLRANIVGKSFIARFVIAAHFRDVFFDRGKFFFGRREFFLCNPCGVARAEARAN